MNALIFLELHFYKDKDGNFWSKKVNDYEYLKRYLAVFETITVCARISHIDSVDGLLLLSGKNVEFAELPDTTGIKETIFNFFKIKKIFEMYVKSTDVFIIRVPNIIAILFYFTVKKSRKKHSLEVVISGDKMIEGKSITTKTINILIDRYLKKMCLNANGVSYVTNNILQKMYPCKAILYGESNNYFTSNYSSIDLFDEDFYEQKWISAIPPKEFIISHTGFMFDERKGQDILIRAVSAVIKKGYPIKVIFIGDGPLKSDYEQMTKDLGLSDVIKFKGLLTEKRIILNELRKSHIFVLPTKAEGLPRAIIEAMASGLPCISSPVDGVPEILNEDFLIDQSDYLAYADKIIDLISDWDKMIEVSNFNYNKSKDYHFKYLSQRRYFFYKKLYDSVNE